MALGGQNSHTVCLLAAAVAQLLVYFLSQQRAGSKSPREYDINCLNEVQTGPAGANDVMTHEGGKDNGNDEKAPPLSSRMKSEAP